MANLAFYLVTLAANPAVLPPQPVEQVQVEPVNSPSIPVETADGHKAWFHPAPGSN